MFRSKLSSVWAKCATLNDNNVFILFAALLLALFVLRSQTCSVRNGARSHRAAVRSSRRLLLSLQLLLMLTIKRERGCSRCAVN